LAAIDRLGEARDPADGEDVPPDPELGRTHADLADEVDDAERARLHEVGVRLDHLHHLVAPRVLERADREQLVELARRLAEVALEAFELALEDLDLALESALPDLLARLLHLDVARVDAGAVRPVVLVGMEQQPAEAAADVDEGLARLEQHLAADEVHLVLLRLLERLRAFLPPGAGVHQPVLVEPVLVEIAPEAVVEAGVVPRLLDRRVAVAELVPPVAHAHQQPGRAVEARVHARADREREAALDVDVAREVALEEADVPEHHDAPSGKTTRKHTEVAAPIERMIFCTAPPRLVSGPARPAWS